MSHRVAGTSFDWKRKQIMQQILSNVALLVTLLAVFSVIEAGLPFVARPSLRRRPANLWLMAVIFIVNAALTLVAAVILGWLPANHAGLLATAHLSPLLTVVVTIAALDLATYGAHVALHKLPLLWRIHRVHHSDRFVDATTAFRQHPFEALWRFACQIVPIVLLGLPLSVVVVYRLLSSVNSILEHSNISLGRTLDSLASRLFVTPNMHKIHHSRVKQETDSNYGNLLSVWDRMLATFTPTQRAYRIEYGLEAIDERRSASIRQLLLMPFSRT